MTSNTLIPVAPDLAVDGGLGSTSRCRAQLSSGDQCPGSATHDITWHCGPCEWSATRAACSPHIRAWAEGGEWRCGRCQAWLTHMITTRGVKP